MADQNTINDLNTVGSLVPLYDLTLTYNFKDRMLIRAAVMTMGNREVISQMGSQVIAVSAVQSQAVAIELTR